MKILRELSEPKLVQVLERREYVVTRQSTSRICMLQGNIDLRPITNSGQAPQRVGTVSAILTEIADHLKISRHQLIERSK